MAVWLICISTDRSWYEGRQARHDEILILREKLMTFYEDQYWSLEYNLNLDRDFAIEKVQPYFFKNFVMRVAASIDVDGGAQEWVPRDYDKIRADGYIVNLCRFRVYLLGRLALRQYGTTTVAIREILDAIDQELGNAD